MKCKFLEISDKKTQIKMLYTQKILWEHSSKDNMN